MGLRINLSSHPPVLCCFILLTDACTNSFKIFLSTSSSLSQNGSMRTHSSFARALKMVISSVVSGAGSGIGRATAVGFGERGARVAVADIDRGRAEAVAAEIVAAGGTAIDAASPADIPAVNPGNGFSDARLLSFDTVVLGALEEQVWPLATDRVRMVEILAGPDEALALLLAGE